MTAAPLTQPGANGLPKIVLSAPGGTRAEVYLNGGQVTSWMPAGGEERLFLSPASEFAPRRAGGIRRDHRVPRQAPFDR